MHAAAAKSLQSYVRLFVTPWTAAHQAPPSVGFSRQEYWSGLPLPSPCYILVSRILFSCSMTLYCLRLFIFIVCSSCFAFCLQYADLTQQVYLGHQWVPLGCRTAKKMLQRPRGCCSVSHSHPLYRTSFLLPAGAAGGGTEMSNH